MGSRETYGTGFRVGAFRFRWKDGIELDIAKKAALATAAFVRIRWASDVALVEINLG